MLNGDGKEICEIINSLISDKKTTLHVQHTFLYISLPLLCTATT